MLLPHALEILPYEFALRLSSIQEFNGVLFLFDTGMLLLLLLMLIVLNTVFWLRWYGIKGTMIMNCPKLVVHEYIVHHNFFLIIVTCLVKAICEFCIKVLSVL